MKKANILSIITLIAGILMVAASLVVYSGRISSCYPPAATWKLFTPEHMAAFRQTCLLDAPITAQFGTFLWLFLPGIALFTIYWLSNRPAVRVRRGVQLSVFLLLIMFDSLFISIYGLLGYPVPGNPVAPAGWVVVTIGILGFLSYLATLALWHWKRWGLLLFQASSIALALFILLGGGSLILSGVIIAGVLGLSLLLRPVSSKLT